MAAPATRWGILSAGKISHDFCCALRTLDPNEHQITAVAARSLEAAKKFAEVHSIDKAYSDYEELARDSDIDIVYIGSIHTQHANWSKIMLTHGKPVLCEKPGGVNSKEVSEVIALAKEKNVFFMEAIWSRHFPIYDEIRSIVSSGRIGQVKMIMANIGFSELINVPRIAKPEHAGGGILDVGIYPVQLVVMLYGNEKPLITTKGFLSEQGVDETAIAILQYSENRFAVVNSHCSLDPSLEADIVGTKGRLRIGKPFWCPSKISIEDSNGTEIKEFPLPQSSATLNFVNSVGLRYQAITVRKCLLEGQIESELMSHEDSQKIADILQHMRHGLGYVLPQDTEKVTMLSQ
ncbi:trans-1,2-dihydrobenzene-1,2-diol dehydrogenase-like [Glandiceps talaboti]